MKLLVTMMILIITITREASEAHLNTNLPSGKYLYPVSHFVRIVLLKNYSCH